MKALTFVSHAVIAATIFAVSWATSIGQDEKLPIDPDKTIGPQGGTPPFNSNSLGGPQQPSDRIESTDILLIETKDGLSAYSMSLGKWDRVIVGLPKDGRPRLKTSVIGPYFAAVIVDDQLFGFSSRAGRWGTLKIPKEYLGKIAPTIGMNILTVKIGDQTFALSPQSGEWRSPDTAPKDLAISFVAAENHLRASLDDPDSQKLTGEIADREAIATQLASQIRTLGKTNREGEAESPKLVELRKKLETTLSATFDFKNQLEHLRVRELQSRLSHLEQQIGRRQSQRKEIIERRARELIEGDETEWNGEPAADITGNSSTTLPVSLPIEPTNSLSISPNYTQIEFQTSDGQNPANRINLEYDSVRYSLPVRLSFAREANKIRHYALRVENGVHFHALMLNIYPVGRHFDEYFRRHPIPVQISYQDLDQVASNNKVTKVIYLPDAKYGGLSLATVETLVSTKLDPGVDPLVEADQRGTILAAISFSKDSDTVSDSTDQSTTNKNGDSAPSKRRELNRIRPDGSRVRTSFANDFLSDPASLPSYKELATGLMTFRDFVEQRQRAFSQLEGRFKNGEVSENVVADAQQNLNVAKRKYQILQQDYAGLLRDLELQLQDAETELESARKQVARFDKAGVEAGVVSQRAYEEAKVRLSKAEIALERLNARYELYKKADERLTDSAYRWSGWGLQLRTSTDKETGELKKTKYRGGMRVVEVDPKSPAAENGIQTGDILVGLDKWETTNVADFGWIMKELEKQAATPEGSKQVKFIVVRDNEEKQGFLPIPPKTGSFYIGVNR